MTVEKKLWLFGTSGCHLCEQAELIIESCDKDLITIESIDIAEHPQWQELYAIRIPVLYNPESKQELAWPFSQSNAQLYINQQIQS